MTDLPCERKIRTKDMRPLEATLKSAVSAVATAAQSIATSGTVPARVQHGNVCTRTQFSPHGQTGATY